MKSKRFFIIIIVGLFLIVIGWFLHVKMQSSIHLKDTQMVQGFIDTVSQADAIKNNDFARTISGHFILKESNCAGLNFLNQDTVLWTNEIACNDPDTLKLRWLTDSIFMTRSTLRINESCPPRIDIYKVVSFDGKHLILNSISTGWNDNKDEKLELLKELK